MIKAMSYKMFLNFKGFSLMELALVVFVSGAILGLAVQYYSIYFAQSLYHTTNENLKISNDALEEYYWLNGRYPCPSDPTLPPTDANYGMEKCRASAADVCPVNLKCTNTGSRDADGDTVNDFVTIGGYPFRTILEGITDTKITQYQAKDGWGMQFTYAVSELMTNASFNILNPASPHFGAIDIVDENNISVADPPKSAHFVLLSHGENKLGATTMGGVKVSKCFVDALGMPADEGDLDPDNPINTSPEKENCDENDAKFSKSSLSTVKDSTFYDDSLMFRETGLEALWTRSLVSAEARIYNTNLGNVGVGIQFPAEKLHVAGDLKAETSIGAMLFCDTTGRRCFDANDIAGVGMKCEIGKVASGVESELIAGAWVRKLICTDFSIPEPTTDVECPSGTYLRGFSNKFADTNGDGIVDVGAICETLF